MRLKQSVYSQVGLWRWAAAYVGLAFSRILGQKPASQLGQTQLLTRLFHGKWEAGVGRGGDNIQFTPKQSRAWHGGSQGVGMLYPHSGLIPPTLGVFILPGKAFRRDPHQPLSNLLSPRALGPSLLSCKEQPWDRR